MLDEIFSVVRVVKMRTQNVNSKSVMCASAQRFYQHKNHFSEQKVVIILPCSSDLQCCAKFLHSITIERYLKRKYLQNISIESA